MPLDQIENDNGFEWIETQETATRKGRAFCMRVSRAKIYKQLTPDQADASREIDKAYEERERGYGYALLGLKTFDPLRVKGGEPSEEVIDAIRKRIGMLHSWEFSCPADWRHSVYALNQYGFTANSYARQTGRSPTTIMTWYKYGLDQYSILRGWKK